MSRRRTNTEWRRDVFASRDPQMTGAVKVLLLYLADEMRPNGEVSVPREQLANDLGIHKARIAERLNKAIEARFLTRVQAGYPGRTAVYRRFWPDAECVQQSGIHMGTAPPDPLGTPYRTHPPQPDWGMDTAPRDAITTANLTVGGADRDERRSNREAAPGAAVDHRRPAPHDREASA